MTMGKQLSNRIRVHITPDQRTMFESAFKVVEDANRDDIPVAILAQVFPDGMEAFVIRGETAEQIQAILSKGNGKTRSSLLNRPQGGL